MTVGCGEDNNDDDNDNDDTDDNNHDSDDNDDGNGDATFLVISTPFGLPDCQTILAIPVPVHQTWRRQ